MPVCCERGSRVEFFWQLMVSASDAFALAGCLPLIIATLCLVLGIRATVWGFIRWLWPPVDSAGRCGAPGAPGGRAEGLDPLRSVGPCLPEGSCPTSPAASTPLRLQPRPAKRTAATPLQCRLPAAASPHNPEQGQQRAGEREGLGAQPLVNSRRTLHTPYLSRSLGRHV